MSPSPLKTANYSCLYLSETANLSSCIKWSGFLSFPETPGINIHVIQSSFFVPSKQTVAADENSAFPKYDIDTLIAAGMCSYNSNLKLTSKTLPIPCENKGNHIIKLLFFTNLHFLVFTSASYHTSGCSWNSSFLWNYLQSSFHCSTCSGIWFCPKRHKAHFFVGWKLSTMFLPW